MAGKPKEKRGCEISGSAEPPANQPGQLTPVEPHLSYGERKKTDAERFECQRYAANAFKGFFRAINCHINRKKEG